MTVAPRCYPSPYLCQQPFIQSYSQYAAQEQGALDPSARGPPPVPGNRPPPIPGNRPGLPPTPVASRQMLQDIPAGHSVHASTILIPTPLAASPSRVSHDTDTDRIFPTIPYNGLTVPNPRAPPPPYGILKVQGYNPSTDAEIIMKACKGFGADKATRRYSLLRFVG